MRASRKKKAITASIAAVTLALSGVALSNSASAASASTIIKIGYISPRTGAYAGFAEGDAYMLRKVRAFFAKGIMSGGKKYTVQILDRDSGSDPAKAGQLADQLINQNKVDILMATSTPETTNPVIAKCEADAVPCITTVAPWQAVFFGGGFSPAKLMQWTHHFFFGIEGFGLSDPGAWSQIATDKKVGVLWPNDSDGQAFRDATNGYTPFATKAGYTVVDPGAYEDGTKDFTSIITKFKQEGVQILAGVPTPPDWITFWTQAAQQGFKPKIVTVGKALFFPATVPAIPNHLGNGLAFAASWGSTFPYKSSLDGTTAAQWAADYQKQTHLAYGQATPNNYTLFELANYAIKKVSNPHDKAAINKALDTANMMTLSGQINFAKGPVPGISTLPTVIGQWQFTGGKWSWVVVDNSQDKSIPVVRGLKPLN